MIRTMYINGEELYNTYGLWLQSKNIPLPEPRMRFVDIEGGNGSIDLSTALTNGSVRFHDREAQFVLTALDGNYVTARNELARKVHGRRVKLEFSDEPGYYYMGRVWVEEIDTLPGDIGLYGIAARLDPFRYTENRVKVVEVNQSGPGVVFRSLVNAGMTPSAVIVTAEIPEGTEIEMLWPYPDGVLYRLFPGENDISLIIEPEQEISTVLTFMSGGGSVKFELEERTI